MTKKQKKNLRRIIISLVLFLIVLTINLILENAFKNDFPNGLASLIPNTNIGWIIPLILYLAIYFYIGYDVLRKSVINICHGQVFDENFLMAIATLGAFGLGIYTGVTTNKPEGFDEACAVLLFYQVGEWFQSYAATKSRKSISSLMDIRPDYANLIKEDGNEVIVDPIDVKIGDLILVKPGERIPLDGIIVEGKTTLDTKALTGEALPKDIEEGDNVISGSINITSSIKIKTTKTFSESTVSKILDLVSNASSEKSKSEAFITKFSRYYTPIVVFLAIALALIPPVLYAIINKEWNKDWGLFTTWIYRSLSFLVVSCPCALVISIPMSFFSGLGGASKNGILIKGSIHLERFNKANVFVFDKTGTLTKGNFAIKEIYPLDKKDEILKTAAIAERDSMHPIALSIKEAYNKTIPNTYTLENILGKGIKATSNDDVILAGNSKLMDMFGIEYIKSNDIGTIVYVAKNNVFLGYIVISDEIREDAKETINYLNSLGAKTVMLTGDNPDVAYHVAKELGLTEFNASLLPQNKVEKVKELLDNKRDDELLCFIGDGINDAPVIMQSDIGIAMGGVGSDAAIEASDIVLMHDDLKSLSICKRIARKTLRIVKENIIFALAIKFIIMILSATGILELESVGKITMWFAVFGDVGVAIICILNAMRCNVKNFKE